MFNNYNYKKFIGELIINDYKGAACDRYEIGTSIEECITSTVGQYTGLTDKNGKKIFEGDIVTMPAYQGGKKKAIIYFKNGKFAVDGSNYSFKDICPKRMEVIGNIYDNKEILDVK